MKLPLVPVGVDPAAAWRRFADLQFDRALALGEEVALPFGRGVIDVIPSANQVVLPETPAAAAVVPEIEAAYLALAATPAVWLAPPGDAYAAALSAAGYVGGRRAVLGLRLAPAAATPPPGVVLLPGRAARAAYTSLCEARAGESDDAFDALRERHLDDPHFDPLIALIDGRPVGTAGLQTRGQTGLVTDVYVTPAARFSDVDATLIDRVLELAARSQLAEVFAEAAAGSEAAMVSRGFVAIATFATWHRSASTKQEAHAAGSTDITHSRVTAK